MMSSMHEVMARALVEARLASARQQQLARQVGNDRGEARRVERRAVPSRWGRWLRRRRVGDTESTVTTSGLGRIGLEGILNRTAERIVESGTWTETETLCAMSAAAGHVSAGAAGALVDWEGSEPARLRAFGIVHGVILRDLGARDRSRLLTQLTGTAPREAPAVAAVQPSCVDPASRRTGESVGDSREEAV